MALLGSSRNNKKKMGSTANHHYLWVISGRLPISSGGDSRCHLNHWHSLPLAYSPVWTFHYCFKWWINSNMMRRTESCDNLFTHIAWNMSRCTFYIPHILHTLPLFSVHFVPNKTFSKPVKHTCVCVHVCTRVCVQPAFNVLYIDGSCASMCISGFQTQPSRELNLLMSVWFNRLSGIRSWKTSSRLSRRLIDKSWLQKAARRLGLFKG